MNTNFIKIDFTVGESIDFDNGCTVYFDEDLWVGVCPYGTDNLFINDNDINKVTEWLKFWNDDRDEHGNLLSNY